MRNRYLILGIIFSTLMVTSCVKDLDVTPKDPNTILSGNIGSNPQYVKEFLGKIYASFMISGQGANGGDDITASDGNFFTTVRALWNCQEITTDEAICAWGDIGIADLNTQTWTSSNPFLTALYQRLGLSITYANQLIGITNGSTDPTIMRYNAEARFLRALAYYYYMDMFGNPPFTTEADGVGKFFPKQIDRKALFNYIVSELKSIESELPDAGENYPQANKAADWMLLARVYLNAEVYTGTAKYDSCQIYAQKVIDSHKYALATDYRQNFSADNDGYQNPEMIFAFEEDGIHTQGYVGTTFIIESSCDATYLKAEDIAGLTNNTNWNGNRARKQFMNVLVDTLATYGNVSVPTSDPYFAQCPDKRVYLRMKKSMDIPSPSSSGDYGIGVWKFTARNHDGTLPANYDVSYACTDFPVFRLADAYLMYAEAVVRGGGDMATAVNYVNEVRDRAYKEGAYGTEPITGRITAGQLTLPFLLNERGREFYYEAQRRTDLVRFGQFTDGTYKWDWKGGVANGVATSKDLNIFPIPSEEVSSNPNIKQNPGY